MYLPGKLPSVCVCVCVMLHCGLVCPLTSKEVIETQYGGLFMMICLLKWTYVYACTSTFSKHFVMHELACTLGLTIDVSGDVIACSL